MASNGLTPQIIYQNIAWFQAYWTARVLMPSADRLMDVRFPGIGLAIVAIFLIPQIIVFVRLSARSPGLETFLVFSMALIVVYPAGRAHRMVLPCLPVLLLTGYLGVDRLLGTCGAKGWLLCLIVANTIQCALEADAQSRHPYWREGFGDFVAVVTNELPHALRSGDSIGSYLENELHALVGLRPRSIASVSADVDAGRLDSALIVHHGDYGPGRHTRAAVLARKGQVELLRITHEGG